MSQAGKAGTDDDKGTKLQSQLPQCSGHIYNTYESDRTPFPVSHRSLETKATVGSIASHHIV